MGAIVYGGWSSLRRRVGRRGAALLFFAFLDFVYAFSLAFPSAEARRSPTLAYVAEIAPTGCWAAVWGAAGLICLVQAFAHRDRLAFGVAMACKVLWGTTMLGGWIVGAVERGYVAAAVWLMMAGWVFIISTWPEPGPIMVPTADPDHVGEGP